MSYLFVHFTGESENGEQIYFSLSKDGLHYEDVGDAKPVLTSDIGTKGVRDPFILRNRLDGFFYIIATDLRIYANPSWDDAVHRGSKSIVIWKSKDLLNWSKPWTVDVPLSFIGNAWAPEAFFDDKRNEYMVFWASFRMKDGKDNKHIIYRAQTKDFVHFSDPYEYIERSCSVIDTTIYKAENIYYRFSKDEDSKGILIDYCDDLQGDFKPIERSNLYDIKGVEGPLAFNLPDGRGCLMVDRFAKGEGYLPIIFNNNNMAEFTPLKDGEFDLGKNLKRHGSVLQITDKEYERVKLNLSCPNSLRGVICESMLE